MRRLIVAEQISLDGVIQSPGDPKEDPSGNFRLGGWIAPYADEVIGQAMQDLLWQPRVLLYDSSASRSLGGGGREYV
jgi:hypothetical protein